MPNHDVFEDREYVIYREGNYDNQYVYNNYSESDNQDNFNNGTMFGYLMCGLLLMVSLGSSCRIFEYGCKRYKDYKTNKELKEVLFQDNTEKNCSICLEDYSKKDKVVQLDCSHIFHRHCIETWFQNKDLKNCPLCRIIV